MKFARHWSVRHARLLQKAYGVAEVLSRGLRPVVNAVGTRRAENSSCRSSVRQSA